MGQLPTPFDNEIWSRIHREVDRQGLLLCTDYDGTLVSFTADPDNTSTPSETLELLRRLRDHPKLQLAIISGRSLTDLRRLVPLEGVTLAGLHGVEIVFETGSKFVWEEVQGCSDQISDLVRRLGTEFADSPGIIVEDKDYAVGLHYRQFRGDPETVKDRFYQVLDSFSLQKFQVLQGAQLLEVRPEGWDKGKTVELLRDRYDHYSPISYIGDDTTDEDAFRVLQTAKLHYPILVSQASEPDTSADFQLENHEQVLSFLRKLSKI